MPDASIDRLLEVLAYGRRHGTPSEAEFVERFLDPVLEAHGGTRVGTYGNLVITRAHADGRAPTTLFSSHTDTVHFTDHPRHAVQVKTRPLRVVSSGEDVLGADDGAGVWLMLEMLAAGLPGRYVFHRAEEIGRLGSMEIAERHPDVLAGMHRAVAFDRRGKTSIITHQMGRRCCSAVFASALAAALNAAQRGFDYEPDHTGTYTDTASYMDLVPECTNVSCGYEMAHTTDETQALQHLRRLRNAVLRVEWEALPTVRVPGAADAE